ncbi:MAG TPA: aminotransferase class IV [Acidimicrobiales bacterium]|nr:aminotransferase class IV [Acidimicrobiales bacterium]
MGKRAAVLARLEPAGPVLADPRAPFLRADDVGVLRGDGIFERFLVICGEPRHFSDHVARLQRSAAQLDLDLPAGEAWQEAVVAAISAWRGSAEWEMRLVCTRGPEEGGEPTAYVLGQELADKVRLQRAEGIAAVIVARGFASGISAEAPWLLLGAKTLSYAVNVAIKRWAERQGADDAIFVGSDGLVWEAGTSAVVIAQGTRPGRRRLVSPPPAVGILDSISVPHLFTAARAAGWETARENLTVEDLFAADGLWLSSSLRFAQVHTLDGKGLPTPATQGELTALAVSA